jgi:hypothetical protein
MPGHGADIGKERTAARCGDAKDMVHLSRIHASRHAVDAGGMGGWRDRHAPLPVSLNRQ